MKISIFGLGYVGSVSAACFAKGGHTVIGVDSQAVKVELINQGKAPIIEPGLAGLMAETTAAGRLKATGDAAQAVAETDLSMVCVGTPGLPNGNVDTGSLTRVCQQIAAAIGRKSGHHTVVIRSTVLPGTMRELVLSTLESVSGKRAGKEFGLANNPEFLRESTAIGDFYMPPKTVIGAVDDACGDEVAELYAGIDAPLLRTSIEVAEMIKYTDNSWHGLKVAFANEIGNICKAIGIDSHEVMDIFCRDSKLNISAAYLKPGFAFGGSCLPKDLRAITYMAKTLDLKVPVLESILPSNRLQIDRALQMIVARDCRRVGVLGFSFKTDTDDLRESPTVELIERLIGKGYDLRLYDRSVNLARLIGANRDHILRTIPHISKLMVETLDDVLDHGQVIVLGNNDPAFEAVPAKLRADQTLVDMVRIPTGAALGGRYDGVNW
jgi:GDP-mannose 6-dehydrogenase